MRLALARGVSRTATRTPSSAGVSGVSEEEVRRNVLDDQITEVIEDQDEDDRRDVDAAEIRQEIADRAQRRLGHPIEKVADHRDRAVVAIDDAKGQQPA